LSEAPGLRLELQSSPMFAFLILAAHAAAAACAAAALSAPAGTLLAAALVALGVAAALRVALLRGPGAVRAVEIGASGLVLERSGGVRQAVPAAGRRYVSRWMVVLPAGGRPGSTVLVTAGMLDAGPFRLLRLWALWGKLPSVPGRHRTNSN
jgi:hypothetical protein